MLRHRAGLVLALMGWAHAPAAARGDDAGLAPQIRAVLAGPGDAVQAGVWFGPASGEPIYQLAAERAVPAASAIKTAVLIELFAAHTGHLDDPLAGGDAVLADDEHPAMTPISPAQRQEVRARLRGATVRTVGAIMMGSERASSTVYSSAANLAIASLGGPAAVTAKIHARNAAFRGLAVRRYVLAARTVTGDNDATPASLAAVLAAIATGRLPGVDAACARTIAQTMIHAEDPALGMHHHKEGELDTDPMVSLKTGFYLRGTGQPPLIYVVAVVLSTAPTGPRDAAHRRLDRMTDALQAILRARGAAAGQSRR